MMMMDQILSNAHSALNFMTAMVTYQLLFHVDTGWLFFLDDLLHNLFYLLSAAACLTFLY